MHMCTRVCACVVSHFLRDVPCLRNDHLERDAADSGAPALLWFCHRAKREACKELLQLNPAGPALPENGQRGQFYDVRGRIPVLCPV